MLDFSLRHHQDAALSVSQYFAVALQQYHTMRQISIRAFGDRKDLRVLDFACGYGRLLRFLIHSIPREQIWASDIQSDAVNYVSERFGIHSIASTAQPEDFQIDQCFDMIWVASLFSHLPEPLFQGWLIRLRNLLTPDGVLCFSTHGDSMLPVDLEMPESGFRYVGGSENDDLSPEIYGTTEVTRDYVDRSLRKVFGDDVRSRYFRKLLAAEQDVYIATSAESGPDLSNFEEFRRGPRGWLDVMRRQNGELHLEGWAASIDDGTLRRLEIEFNSEYTVLTPSEPRPKVAEALGDPRMHHCGFSCTLPWPPDTDSAYLVISAVSRQGERGLVFAGEVGR